MYKHIFPDERHYAFQEEKTELKYPISEIDGEYIRGWLVLGPFFPDDLETDFLADMGGEANIAVAKAIHYNSPRKGLTIPLAMSPSPI